MFLTRKQYDSLVPMFDPKLAVWERATKVWSLEGVNVVFADAGDRDTFLRSCPACGDSGYAEEDDGCLSQSRACPACDPDIGAI